MATTRGVQRQEYAALGLGGGAALAVTTVTGWAVGESFSGDAIAVTGPRSEMVAMAALGVFGMLLGVGCLVTSQRWKRVAIAAAFLMLPTGAAGFLLSTYEHGHPERTVRLTEDREKADRIASGTEEGSWSLYLGVGGGVALVAATLLMLTEERSDRPERRRRKQEG